MNQVQTDLEGGRFVNLLASLVLLFLLVPALEGSELGGGVLDVFVSGSLLLTLHALRGRQRAFLWGVLLALPAIAAAAGAHLFHSAILLSAGHGFGLLFFLLTGSTILKQVLEPGAGSRLQAAVCGYLLLGLGWALVFSTLEHVSPGSFGDPLGTGAQNHAVLAGMPHLIYFSFTTLTTLGYGDVVPTSTLARSLSTLEAVLGQLYLALLVARLVGVRAAQLAEDQREEGQGAC